MPHRIAKNSILSRKMLNSIDSLKMRIKIIQGLFLILLTVLANSSFANSIEEFAMRFNAHGEWQQGGVIRAKSPLNTKDIKLNGDTLLIHEDGSFVFAFGRDAQIQNQLEYTLNTEVHKLPFTIKQRHYEIQRIDNLPKDKVNVPEEALGQIYTEYALAKQARHQLRTSNAFSQSFILPVSGIVTGVYGSQRILNGEPRRPHYGIDIAAPEGKPVIAPASGIIELVHEDMYFSGGTLILNHGMGITSTFLHLSEILVTLGEQVEQGQPIAEVGATGRVTGAHLDWRMNWFDVRFDPVLILPQREKDKLFKS